MEIVKKGIRMSRLFIYQTMMNKYSQMPTTGRGLEKVDGILPITTPPSLEGKKSGFDKSENILIY